MLIVIYRTYQIITLISVAHNVELPVTGKKWTNISKIGKCQTFPKKPIPLPGPGLRFWQIPLTLDLVFDQNLTRVFDQHLTCN